MSEGVKKLDVTRLVTVAQLAKLNPAFTNGRLRWLIFNGWKNGFDECIVRLEERGLLIDLDAFEAWLEKRRARRLKPVIA